MDFARYLCHNTGRHHLAAGPSPAHNNGINGDGKKPPRLMPSVRQIQAVKDRWFGASFANVHQKKSTILEKSLSCQWVMDDLTNNWYLSHKFVGRPPISSKNAPFLNVHRHLRDGQMQSLLGTSATVGFQIDLGMKMGYSTTPFSGKVYEEDCCNIFII